MSPECFKDVCQRLRSKKSKMLRDYFIIAEKAYREWFGATVYERRKCEDPMVTKMKTEEIKNYYDLPEGPVAYRETFLQRGTKYEKAGHTGDLAIRLPQLQKTYPGVHHFEQAISSPHPQSIEECFHDIASPARIPCKGSPCPREVYFADDIDAEKEWNMPKSCTQKT